MRKSTKHRTASSLPAGLFALHADICKTLAHPKRLQILHALRSGERSVAALRARLRISKTNLSQHLAILRGRNVVVSRRQGANIYYSVSSSKIIRACDLMREVLDEHMRRSSRMMRSWRRR